MKNKSTKNPKKVAANSNMVNISLIGAGIAGLAATAYFFLGKKGEEHQKNLKAWAIKMKGDVVEKIEVAKEISEPAYHRIIDNVAKKYKKSKKAGEEEVNELTNDLKKHWKTITDLTKTVKKDTIK